jgi:hypothetical protein
MAAAAAINTTDLTHVDASALRQLLSHVTGALSCPASTACPVPLATVPAVVGQLSWPALHRAAASLAPGQEQCTCLHWSGPEMMDPSHDQHMHVACIDGCLLVDDALAVLLVAAKQYAAAAADAAAAASQPCAVTPTSTMATPASISAPQAPSRPPTLLETPSTCSGTST